MATNYEHMADLITRTHCVANVPYTRKFSPGEKFRQFHHPLLLAKFLSHEHFVLCNDYIEDMATFTALAKIFVQRKFCRIRYSLKSLVCS